MKAEFYGGVWDDQTHNVESDRLFVYAPRFGKAGVSWIQPQAVKTASSMTMETYKLALRYPDRLVYLSVDDDITKPFWMAFTECDPHVLFYMWREGRFSRLVTERCGWWSGIYGQAFLKVCERKHRAAKMRKLRRKKKSAGKNDPQ